MRLSSAVSLIPSLTDWASKIVTDAEFQNTGLERSAGLTKDLEWFASEGHEIPPVGDEGNKYAELLKTLAENDPPAFICHFYNVYFAHSAGGKFIGQKVPCMITFYGPHHKFSSV